MTQLPDPISERSTSAGRQLRGGSNARWIESGNEKMATHLEDSAFRSDPLCDGGRSEAFHPGSSQRSALCDDNSAKSKRVLREACGPSAAKGARGDAELSVRRPAVISHRVKPPSRAASILIERHRDDAARKLAFRGLYEARRLRSRIRFSFWTAVAAEIDARRLTARD
jgi:hypothetical protein